MQLSSKVPAVLKETLGLQDNAILFAAMGTLKRGGSNYHLLSTSQFIGVGSTPPDYGMKSLGGFPSLIQGSKEVSVEVFSINESTLRKLDLLEGYREDNPDSSFFTRKKIKIILDDNNSEVIAWIYYVAHPETIASRPDHLIEDDRGRLTWDVIRFTYN